MIDVWSAVRWWDEWQLRILVLASLGLQWFLLVAAPMRRYTIPQFFRALIWLAYISSDALAIYALATLFNRYARASNGDQTGVLEVLWAPVLLIHLGGQREVNAYAIEDNELWTRHTVTLVSQVAVALYAFCKSWPNSTDTRLVAAAVVLFVVGGLSFCEKPWAFYRARIHRLEVVSSLIQGTRPRENKCCFCFNELDEEKLVHKIKTTVLSHCFCGRKKGGNSSTVWSVRNRVHMILADLSLFAAASDLTRRQQLQQGSSSSSPSPSVLFTEILSRPIGAESFAKTWLTKAFGLIYTRYNVVWTPAYLAYHLLLLPVLHAAAIVLFAESHKRGVYNPTDVKTTYILLPFTAVLDLLGVFIPELLHRLMDALDVPSLCEWIAQYNLIDAALRRRRPIIGGLIIKCQLERYFLWDWKSDNKLFNKVAGYLIIDWWNHNEYNTAGLDLSSYRNFDAKAHNWVLSEELRTTACGEGTEVRKSLLASFDRSVLIWHIATDLCFCLKAPTAPLSSREVRTEAISNYMSYLLNFRPDMLLTGSRRHLFAEAMGNIQSILREEMLPVGRHFKNPNKVANDKALMECIFRHAWSREGNGPVKYPLVHDACRLAEELLELPDDTRFELMYRVWLGMLLYSATMCRGYLHAKSLGEGGEFLSFVWLLLCTTGSKTLADKLQMPPDKDGTDDGQQPTAQNTYEQYTIPDDDE